MPDLLILAHAGSWDQRFQVTSLAASTAASGRRVDLALFFSALDCWVAGGWDRLDPQPPICAERLAQVGAPALSSMLEGSRREGALRLFACSASMRFLGLEPEDVQSRVDVIAGWQTFSKLTFEAQRVVTL